ncbi:MAG: glycosyltransferase family 39 protein [Nanoarchaeota archaeon]
MEIDKNKLQQNILDFFDKNSNFILITVLVFALILRLKYLTINQAVWYDEAEYLGVAKNWAFNLTSYQLHYVRPPFLSLLMAAMYKIGFGELGIRIMMLIFSMIGILFTYLLGKEIFNKWVGIISGFLMSILYVNLFYTARILTDLISTTFWLISMWLFWKGMIKKESKWYLWLLGPSLVIGVLTKFPFGLIVFVFLLYLIVTEGVKFLKDKNLWIGISAAILCFTPYALWYYLTYSKIPILGPAGFYNTLSQIGSYIGFIPIVFQSPIPGLINISPYFGHFLLLLLIIGVLTALFNIIVGYNLLRNDKGLKKDVLILLWIIIPFIFFAFFAGQIAEDRYLTYIYPATFLIISLVLVRIYNLVKKFNTIFALCIILLILILSSFAQISYADKIIKIKSTSYIQFKQAGNWIKENSDRNDRVISTGEPQLNYYAERGIIYWPEDYEIDEFLDKNKDVKYLVLSVLEQSPQWSYQWPNQNPDKVAPVQVYTDSQQRPILIIYEVKR